MSISGFFKSRRQVFEENFLPYMTAIYRTSLRLTRSSYDADDLTQETFFRAYEAFLKGPTITSPKAWLFKIMHNTYINQQTSLSAKAQKISLQDAPEIQTPETPEYHFLLKDAGDRLQKAFCAMQPEYQYVLLLCDSEELSYSEIADILQCPVGTVRSRLSRAREIIKCAVYGEEEV